MLTAANNVGMIGQRPPPLNRPRPQANSSKNAPPTIKRSAPTANGVAPAGANACAVPVVPHNTAANKTSAVPRCRIK